MTEAAETDSLDALAAEARRQLRLLAYPARPWVPETGEGVLDVAVVGAGQTGLAAAFGLARERVERVRVFDAAPPGGAGVWTTFARMRTLRTPKHVTGPDLGLPALTPEAYFTARDGAAAWAALRKIGREDWQRYLDWVAATVGVAVVHRHRLTRIGPDPAGLRLDFETPEGEVAVLARRLVLATGMDGTGGWATPAPFDALPPALVSHTAGPVDFAGLAGRRVVVVGAGASAFDNLACALEAGAARAVMLVRRARLPRVNPFRWMEQAGFLGQFHALPDALKWRFVRHVVTLNQPPPPESWDRVAGDPRFELRLASPVTAVRAEEGEAVLETPGGTVRADHVILGTGTAWDLALRPELAPLAPHVLLWGDAYRPPPGEEHAELARWPYLSPDFSLRERRPGEAPHLARIHVAGYGALLSMGLSGAAISGMKYGVARLVDGLCRALWLEDAERHLADLLAYDAPEFDRPVPQEAASEARAA